MSPTPEEQARGSLTLRGLGQRGRAASAQPVTPLQGEQDKAAHKAQASSCFLGPLEPGTASPEATAVLCAVTRRLSRAREGLGRGSSATSCHSGLRGRHHGAERAEEKRHWAGGGWSPMSAGDLFLLPGSPAQAGPSRCPRGLLWCSLLPVHAHSCRMVPIKPFLQLRRPLT